MKGRVSCSACGELQILDSPVCSVCGKGLNEGFQPLDVIRSSYNLQGKNLGLKDPDVDQPLFRPRGDAVSDTAWACTVYSMVPYLGILFIPVAVVIGGFSFVKAHRAGDERIARTALMSVMVSIALVMIQLVLWWLLYLIPEIGL